MEQSWAKFVAVGKLALSIKTLLKRSRSTQSIWNRNRVVGQFELGGFFGGRMNQFDDLAEGRNHCNLAFNLECVHA